MNSPLRWTSLFFVAGLPTLHADEPLYTRHQDVIYGRKAGLALTMDIFAPKTSANGAAAILIVSGGWSSSRDFPVKFAFVDELVKRGYTVFAVVHSSQPKFTIPEIIPDIHRAVRYVRHRARDFQIDPNRVGIYGASSGGHLALMVATTGGDVQPNARDPVDRESSRVQAVACFFAPTDFLNYGKPGENALGRGPQANLKAAFDFQELDQQTKSYVGVTDEEKVRSIGRAISPIDHVTGQTPPTLLFHGSADKLVPIQQSESFVQRLTEKGVKSKLVAKPGVGHAYGLVSGLGFGWPNVVQDLAAIADWFDQHLPKPDTAGRPADR
jgi:acetyl esterase/lipase